MLLSIHAGYAIVSTAVVCAILEMISGLDPSLLTAEPRYLKLDTVSSLWPFALISQVIQLVLLAPVRLLLSHRYQLKSVRLLLSFLRC